MYSMCIRNRVILALMSYVDRSMLVLNLTAVILVYKSIKTKIVHTFNRSIVHIIYFN